MSQTLTDNLNIGIARILQHGDNSILSFDLLDNDVQKASEAINNILASDISEALTYSNNNRVQKRYTNALLIGLLVFIFIVIIIFVLKKLFGIRVIN